MARLRTVPRLRCRVDTRNDTSFSILAPPPPLPVSRGDNSPEIDAIIETNRWHGYRLNPDRVKIAGLIQGIRRQGCGPARNIYRGFHPANAGVRRLTGQMSGAAFRAGPPIMAIRRACTGWRRAELNR